MAVALLVERPVVLAGILAVLALLWIRVSSSKEMSSAFKMLLPIAFLVLMIQMIFFPGKEVLFSVDLPISFPYLGKCVCITMEGVLVGLKVALRLLIIVVSTSLVAETTSLEMTISSLVKSGIPPDMAIAATTALNLLTILKRDIQEIMQAQKVRGLRDLDSKNVIRRLRAYSSLIVPVFLEAFLAARQMNIAMRSRAFGAKPSRTMLCEARIGKVDLFIIAISLIVSTVVIALVG